MKLELLTIQAEGSLDDRGCILGSRGITLACTDDAWSSWIGAELPEDAPRGVLNRSSSRRQVT